MYILGIDLSSVKAGIAIIDEDEKLILSEIIRFNMYSSLEQKAIQLEDYFLGIKEKYRRIDKICLENTLMTVFNGFGNAKTVYILNTFSGMCRYIIYKVFGKEAQLLNVKSTRSKLGLKFVNGKGKKESKKKVIDFVVSKYGDSFQYMVTKKGNYGPGIDDKADAIITALGGLIF